MPKSPCSIGSVRYPSPRGSPTDSREEPKIIYGTNPPSSGNHYLVWAAYRVYDTAIPEGYWVHDLEHGAVVLTYNCPNGCASDVAAAKAMIDELPDDPLCTGLPEGVRHRIVMTPDLKLEVPFAASAWGYTLKAQCFDAATFRSFIDRHYGNGPEALCDNGAQVTDDPATCGD